MDVVLLQGIRLQLFIRQETRGGARASAVGAEQERSTFPRTTPLVLQVKEKSAPDFDADFKQRH